MTVPDEPEILCIGNAMVDVFAALDGEHLLCRYGLNQPVQHVEIERLAEIIANLPTPHTIASGGGAANVAKIAGFLGAKASFIGAVGKNAEGNGPDSFGQLFERDLTAADVNLKLHYKPSPTGICLYLKTGEKTCIAASPSAALLLSESDISDDDARSTRIVVVDGYMLGRTSLTRHILELAAKYGTAVAIDLGAADIASENAAEIMDYVNRYPLMLFMNKKEAEAFAKASTKTAAESFFREKEEKSEIAFQRTCSFLQSLTERKTFPVIVLKLGPKGAICFSEGKSYLAETEEIVPKESTGAGDAFCAGFLLAWVRRRPVSECVDMGNQTARLVLDTAGTAAKSSKFSGLADQLKNR